MAKAAPDKKPESSNRGWLMHAPIGVVVALGGLVFSLSDEPSAFSSGRVAVGSVGNAPVAALSLPLFADAPSDAWSASDPATAGSGSDLPSSLTNLNYLPADVRLGEGLHRDAILAQHIVTWVAPKQAAGPDGPTESVSNRMAAGVSNDSGVDAPTGSSPTKMTGPSPTKATTTGRHIPTSSEPAKLALAHEQLTPTDDGEVIQAPVTIALDQDMLKRRTADFLARYYRRSRAKVGGYVEHAFAAGRVHGVDPLLITAIMSIESSLNPKARSNKGAKGLMQVLVAVHTEKFKPYGGTKNAYDPRTSVMVGAKILERMIRRTGSVQGALKHYVGAANLRSDGGYGAKVIRMRDRIWHAAQGQPVPKAIEIVAATERANVAQLIAAGELRTADAADMANPGADETRLD